MYIFSHHLLRCYLTTPAYIKQASYLFLDILDEVFLWSMPPFYTQFRVYLFAGSNWSQGGQHPQLPYHPEDYQTAPAATWPVFTEASRYFTDLGSIVSSWLWITVCFNNPSLFWLWNMTLHLVLAFSIAAYSWYDIQNFPLLNKCVWHLLSLWKLKAVLQPALTHTDNWYIKVLTLHF